MDPQIVDSGVVVKWFVGEEFSDEALRLHQRYLNQEVRLLAPEFMLAEVGNVIWKKVRFQGFSPTDAQSMIQTVRDFPFLLTPTAELLEEAYGLAIAHQRTVYDCLYLALCLREQCPFITADEKLYNAVRSHFPNLVWLRDYT